MIITALEYDFLLLLDFVSLGHSDFNSSWPRLVLFLKTIPAPQSKQRDVGSQLQPESIHHANTIVTSSGKGYVDELENNSHQNTSQIRDTQTCDTRSTVMFFKPIENILSSGSILLS